MTIDESIDEHYGYFLICFPQFQTIAEKVGEECGLTTQQAAVAFMRFLRWIGGDDDGGGEEAEEMPMAIEIAAQFFKRAA